MAIRAHKAILIARSKHFRELFAKRREKKQNINEIPVKKVTLETFKRLLEYIYRDHVTDMSKGVASQLAQVINPVPTLLSRGESAETSCSPRRLPRHSIWND